MKKLILISALLFSFNGYSNEITEEVAIAKLHEFFFLLDVDNYEGTLEILKNLYNKMAKGGVVAFDEYALQGHGESDAVDEFLSDKKIKLKSFSWAKTPTAYFIIE